MLVRLPGSACLHPPSKRVQAREISKEGHATVLGSRIQTAAAASSYVSGRHAASRRVGLRSAADNGTSASGPLAPNFGNGCH